MPKRSTVGLAYDYVSMKPWRVAWSVCQLSIVLGERTRTSSDETFSARTVESHRFLDRGWQLFVSAQTSRTTWTRFGTDVRDVVLTLAASHLSSDAQTIPESHRPSRCNFQLCRHSSADLDAGTKGIYAVRTPDVSRPMCRDDTCVELPRRLGGAAQSNTRVGRRRTSGAPGFPFETFVSGVLATVHADILAFLSLPPATNLPPSILLASRKPERVVARAPAVVAATGTLPYTTSGVSTVPNLAGATAATLTRSRSGRHSGNYEVVVSRLRCCDEHPTAVLT